MSRRRAPTARRADLAGSLEHGRQHDVHDADPSDEEGDAGDAPHDDAEEALRATALFEQRLGNDELEVAGAAVDAIDQRPYDLRGRARVCLGVEADDEIVERCLQRRSVEFPARRRHGQVDLARRRPELNALERRCAAFVLEHAHHRQPNVVDLEIASQRRSVAEQLAPHAGTDHADLGVASLVQRIEEPSLGKAEPRDLGLTGRHAVDGGFRLGGRREHLVGLDLESRDDQVDAGNRVLNRLGIAPRQSLRLLPDLLELLVLHFLRAEDHVAQPESLYHFERLPFRPGADRQHRDHRSDAEDHPEHGQRRPELVGREVVERAFERFREGHRAPGSAAAEPPAAAGWSSPATAKGSRRAISSPTASPCSTTTRPTAAGPTVTSAGTNSLPTRL